MNRFEKYNFVGKLSSQELCDVLSFGLSWPKPEKKGSKGFSIFALGWLKSNKQCSERFASLVQKHSGNFIFAWDKALRLNDFSSFARAVEIFITNISASDAVDKDMPIFRANNKNKNSFVFVRILKSIAVFLAGRDGAETFLEQVISAGSCGSDYLFLVARAQLLLENDDYRKAADIALQAEYHIAYDLCMSKTIFATQEALFKNGMTPDIDYDFSDQEKRFCSLPFTTFNLFSQSDNENFYYGLCQCRGWSPLVFKFNMEECWNSDDAQEMRRSILDGSYKYCDILRCPSLRGHRLPLSKDVEDEFQRDIIDNSRTNISGGPETLFLAYDRSCNISCPSCRKDVYMADKNTVQVYNDMKDYIINVFMPHVKYLQLNQTGEALASAHFTNLLKSITPSKYPNLKIRLMSNTKLLSEKTWQMLGPVTDCFDSLVLSIDGATPKTLEKLRRGLSWDRMIGALEFVKELRRRSKISKINVMYIVQKDNFREIPKMVELCSQYLCDNIEFSPITGHGEYSSEQFKEMNVNDPKHPLKAEYNKIKKDTIMLVDQLRKNEKEILAQGRSVPNVSFRR